MIFPRFHKSYGDLQNLLVFSSLRFIFLFSDLPVSVGFQPQIPSHELAIP